MNTNTLLGMLVVGLLPGAAAAQGDCACDKMLENGIYSNFKVTNTGNFSQDFRTYLLSDSFKQDMKAGSWGASITVPIKGVPVSLGANAADSEQKQFREQLLQDARFSVSGSSYQSLVSSVPNVDLAKTYTDCVERTCQFGLHANAVAGERWVNFTITYRPQYNHDPIPKVTMLEVRNGTNPKSSLAKGKPVLNYNSIVCDRDPRQDVLLVLETDRGAVTYKVPGDSTPESARDMPVGTILTSYLSVEQFYEATKANVSSPGGIWTSQRSKWCPADGRAVPNSIFQKIASQDRVPDLRGMFLRGLNTMESQVPQVPLDAARRDPDDRSVGSYQADEFKEHDHNYWGYAGADGNRSGQQDALYSKAQIPTAPRGGKETRPKNVAVYYYIRIN